VSVEVGLALWESLWTLWFPKHTLWNQDCPWSKWTQSRTKIDFEKLLCETCWLDLHKQTAVQHLVHWLTSKSDKISLWKVQDLGHRPDAFSL